MEIRHACTINTYTQTVQSTVQYLRHRFGHVFTKETAVQNQGGVKIEKEVRSHHASIY